MASQATKRHFESEIARSAKLLGLDYTKLCVPQRGQVKVAGTGYDAFLVHRGRHVPLELKSLKAATRFPLGSVGCDQQRALDNKLASGCRAFLLVNFRQDHPDPGYRRPGNRAYLFDWSQWERLVAACRGCGRKSVPRSWFDMKDGFFAPLPRLKADGGPVWDLKLLTVVLDMGD